MAQGRIFAGIELGGTKTIVALGDEGGRVVERMRFPTTAPEELIETISAYLKDRINLTGPFEGLGVGAFGPVVIDASAEDYGEVSGTNKKGWAGFNVYRALKQAFDVPMKLVTDVTAAGIGEAAYGNLRGVDLGLYLTIGTGIGGALLHKGMPLPALLHPEMGHLPLTRQDGDMAPSTCAFHPNCAEGLAAGPAIEARFGHPLNHFAPDGPEYALVANYLGQLLASLQLATSPQRIVVGGGVAQAEGLLERVRANMRHHIAGYVDRDLDDPGFLVAPYLGGDAGAIGALIMGEVAANSDIAVLSG